MYGVEKVALFKNLRGIEMNNEFFFEIHFLCMQRVVFYPRGTLSASQLAQDPCWNALKIF